MKLTFNNAKHLFLIAFAVILIIWPSIYNCFPLLYSDTGTYILSSVHIEIPLDRPLFYGLFIRATSMQAHLWVTIIVQALITFWILKKLVQQLYPNKNQTLLFSIIFLLSILTGLPWYTSQIMPDLFTALGVLNLYLIFSNKSRNFKEQVLLHLTLYFTIGTHYSNILIIGGMIFIVALFNVKKIWQNTYQYRLRTISTTITIIAVAFTHALTNYSQNGHFKMSRGSNLFLAAKCLESPLLKSYMKANMNRIDIPFAENIDSIPNSACGFLWSSNSPLNQIGVDRVQINEAYGPVLKDLFSQPYYRNWFIEESIQSTIEQLKFHKVGSGMVSYKDSTNGCYFMIKKYYENEFNQFYHAKQQQLALGLEDNYHKYISQWVFYFSILVIVVGLFFNRVRNHLSPLILFILTGVFMNAFITSSLANTYDRLQVRVVWLLTLMALIILYEFIRGKIENRSNITN